MECKSKYRTNFLLRVTIIALHTDFHFMLDLEKKTPKIAKFFDTMDKVISFVRSSPKQTHLLGRKMPKHGDTRWLSRDTALMAVDSSYEELGSSFYDMSRDANEKAETEVTAQGLCVQMQHISICFFP